MINNVYGAEVNLILPFSFVYHICFVVKCHRSSDAYFVKINTGLRFFKILFY